MYLSVFTRSLSIMALFLEKFTLFKRTNIFPGLRDVHKPGSQYIVRDASRNDWKLLFIQWDLDALRHRNST